MMAASDLLFLVIALSISSGCAKADKGVQSDSVSANLRSAQGVLVCYVGFETRFVAGMTEARVANPQWCNYEIDTDRFLGMLREVKEPRPYRPNDVRAKINALPEPYFVDGTGMVRIEKNFYEVDANHFVKLLKLRVTNPSSLPDRP